jgi:mono/diheme cytochrome c family protein
MHRAKLFRPPMADLLSTLALVLCASRPLFASDSAEAKKIFNQRCTSCHTFGKGVKVGPDLKGVTQRRTRPWLLRFIRSSQSVIKDGDPIATGLFDQFRRQRMPDWLDLSESQIESILDWISADGPDQKEPDERDAELATSADIERARGLFNGSVGFANGGVACGTCHSIRDNDQTIGGSLGPNLTAAYLRYRDRGLTLFLRKPCFQREPETSAAHFLTPDEAFALKAYLRQAALPGSFVTPAAAPPAPAPPAAPSPPPEAAPIQAGFRVVRHHKHKRGGR